MAVHSTLCVPSGILELCLTTITLTGLKHYLKMFDIRYLSDIFFEDW